MIHSFHCKDTQSLFEGGSLRRFRTIQDAAIRKLSYLHEAAELRDLASPPRNRLESLKGDRVGQHSIRINAQWLMCFVWTAAGPSHVEIVDYH